MFESSQIISPNTQQWQKHESGQSPHRNILSSLSRRFVSFGSFLTSPIMRLTEPGCPIASRRAIQPVPAPVRLRTKAAKIALRSSPFLSVARACLAQPGHEHRMVLLGLKDPLAAIAAGHHVIYRAGILESQRTNHAPKQSAPSSPLKPLCFVAGTDPTDSGCSNVEKRFRFRRTQWVGTANAIGWRAYVHLASSRTAPVPGPCRAPRPWPPCAGGTRPDGQGGGRRAGVTNRGTAVFCKSLPPSSY